jgi:hypothetical protein
MSMTLRPEYYWTPCIQLTMRRLMTRIAQPKRHLTPRQGRQASQVKLRMMKEKSWACKSQELQAAADQHDIKRSYDGLKTVYGPRDSGSTPVRSKDGTTLITDQDKILKRWTEHFETVRNQPAVFDDSVLSEIIQ